MGFILHIDTSGHRGIVALAEEGIYTQSFCNNDAMQHAAFLQPAIAQVIKNAGIAYNQIDAVAISNGPGSYTGLRVGLASAKGLCFAWNIPLITINSLELMAFAVWQNRTVVLDNQQEPCSLNDDKNTLLVKTNNEKTLPVLYCPMIDARRMEVFFALYNEAMEPIIPTGTAIVDAHFLHEYLTDHSIYYFGTGATKWENLEPASTAICMVEPSLDKALCKISYQKYLLSNFTSLATAEPFYAKEFFTTHPAYSNKPTII